MPTRDLWVGWPASATLLATIVSLNMSFAGVAGESCLESPNREPDPGSRWYYRSDPATHQRCWLVKKLEPNGSAAGTSQTAILPNRDKRTRAQPESQKPEKLAAALPLTAAEREALFREFLQWRERQRSSP